jgi:hypothetical protein
VILHLAASSPLQAVKVIVICISLVVLEFLGVALLIAPRATARKLISAVRGLVGRSSIARLARPARSRDSAQASGRGS